MITSKNALGVETVPAGEEQAIERIKQALRRSWEQNNPADEKLARRMFHAKSHGLVQAEFTVEDNLPEALRFGVFAKAAKYPAWLRFSNGMPRPKGDRTRDVRAVAIKLMNVQGAQILDPNAGTQDFILANHPGFFVKDAHHFAALMSNPLLFLLGLSPLGLRWREAKNAIGSLFANMSTPLGAQYWSQTPSKLGEGAVKYTVRPTTVGLYLNNPRTGPNRLREAMVAHLTDADASFDFLVQPQTDARRMPIEDPRIIWDERLSPFQKVATIRIPKQVFDTPERDNFSEHLSFSPWRSLEAHRPLGGINRVRRVMYAFISELRHQRNGVPEKEPVV